MAGERDVLAEALRAAMWTMGASAGIPVERRQEWSAIGERLIRAELAAGGYTLSRSEPTIGDCSCVDAGASGHRVPCRAATPSPEPLPLEVERLARAVAAADAHEWDVGGPEQWAVAIAREYAALREPDRPT